VRRIASATVFPLLLAAAVGGAAWALGRGVPIERVLGVASLASIVAVALLERLLPYRRDWNRRQGDLLTDAIYLPTSVGLNGAVEPVARLAGVAVGSWLSAVLGVGLWPTAWPLLAQFALACVVAEAFDYWAHRVMHESALLWRFHATHHSAPRLYWLNAARFHPVDLGLLNVVSYVPLALLGCPESTIMLFALFDAVFGMLQHSNIDVRLGPLNRVFSMAEPHRWHHSLVLEEANTNYGSNLIIWDLVFGTFFLPGDREPPARIGIAAMPAFPPGYLAQLAAPFRWRRVQDEAKGRETPASP
jgi:sterol desaturase/sphingolipid hydroxylase (fatty acid hydroxylase superfamily)